MSRFLIKVRRANRSVWHKLVNANTPAEALERAKADGLAVSPDCSVEVEQCDPSPAHLPPQNGRLY